MARFRATTENLWFCEVWTGDGYGFIRNVTGKDFDDEALAFYDRFRVTEILEEVSSIFGYFVSALRLTCTGSYRIVQRCFSERTSRLRGYFENVQL